MLKKQAYLDNLNTLAGSFKQNKEELLSIKEVLLEDLTLAQNMVKLKYILETLGLNKNMKFNFIKFERDYLKGTTQISITRASALGFSAKFCRLTDILNFNYVTLFYDSAKKAIGILPTNKEEKGSFKITKEKTTASVSITSFLNMYQLNPKTYHGRYDWTTETIPDIGKVYIIVLDNKNEPTT